MLKQAEDELVTIPKWEYENLKRELNELKRMIFGVKSERFIGTNQDQLNLFQDDQPLSGSETTEQITYSRKKKKQKHHPIRAVLPAHFPRIEEVIEPDAIPEQARKIGEEITEQLEYNPARLFVRKIIRPKYALPADQGVLIAALPILTLPKSNAGASLLAHLMVSKFIDHIPFYRLRQIFKRQDFEVSDSTLGGWFNATCDLLQPLYTCLENKVLQGNYLQMDESPIGVQHAHKKAALHTGYHWVIHAPVERMVLFSYHPSRSRAAPQKLLKDFSGTLQTDGYTIYQNLQTAYPVTLLGCMAHARRYFEKALDNDPQRARYALEQIQLLYSMERNARERNSHEQTIRRYRRRFAEPILQQLHEWMLENLNKVLPKSAIGKAIAYNLKLWPNLVRYTQHGKYLIDNNQIENLIRPLALERKNYLFAGSHKAAQRAAMMYSFFATCKINHIEPYQWLYHVLQHIHEYKAGELHKLLPGKHL